MTLFHLVSKYVGFNNAVNYGDKIDFSFKKIGLCSLLIPDCLEGF